MTQNFWESASGTAALRVQALRAERGWSLARLADECAKVGAPQLNANVLTNLLTRKQRRRDLTVEEVGALAAVFGLPPARLLPELLEPIDDLRRLVLHFDSAVQAEQAHQWLSLLEVLVRAVRDDYIAKEAGNG